ncbi:MAG: methionine biosynthesis protein MetW [Spirochaetaceae bacterium]|nr:methionine biosynthesis protein MetW [Spirochaetaceae bacterium]
MSTPPSAQPGQAGKSARSAKSGLPHIDYDEIVKLVPHGSNVLDLGCGDGELLHRLIAAKQVRGRGVDIEESMIIESISRGISVFQGDLDEGLRDYATGSYEYVILNQTLQATHRPLLVLEEMLRVGKHAIVSFPNFGYFRVRLQFLFSGRMPVTRDLPYMWYNTPNIHLCTRKDFLDYCTDKGVAILKEIAISKRGTISPLFANWRATEVLFVLSGTGARS